MLKFSGTSLKMTILRNFLIFHFFGKILTHASMGDCFFSMQPLCPPQEPECHLARRQIVFICNLCVSGIVVRGGGKAAIFTLMLIWGDLTSHRIAKTNLT